MHTELKQLFINITVMFSVVIVPILVVVGAYRLFSGLSGQTQRVPVRNGEEQ